MVMSSKKLAKHLDISARSIHRAALQGDIPYHRIGQRMLFELDEVLLATKVERPPSHQHYSNIRP